MLEINDNKNKFYQWDTGQTLRIGQGVTCDEVHFCNGNEAATLVCKVKERDGQRVVEVPNILLQEAKPITAYICKRLENGTETRFAKAFQVVSRAMPGNYIYNETEAQTWASLDIRIKNLEEEIRRRD